MVNCPVDCQICKLVLVSLPKNSPSVRRGYLLLMETICKSPICFPQKGDQFLVDRYARLYKADNRPVQKGLGTCAHPSVIIKIICIAAYYHFDTHTITVVGILLHLRARESAKVVNFSDC